jgi:hypothetical protein
MKADDMTVMPRRSSRLARRWSQLALGAAGVLAASVIIRAAAAADAGTPPVPAAPADQSLVDGERMYRKGVLPSGEPMRVAMAGGAAMPGTSFACASCHTRSGLGTMEEGLRTLPINGPNLFRPLYRYYPNLSDSEREELLPAKFQTPPRRPAYTDETLSAAIRKGIDPAGRPLSSVMPRYVLGDR